MADFGYDVSDYCGVDPLFGTLEEFDRLVEDAHRLRLRVLIDWVPNHTSVEHPWFAAARSSRDDPRRDFYVWRDGRDGDPAVPPNNWVRAFGEGPAWTFDDTTGQWYLHLFLPEQPDLNWANPEVVAAMTDTLRFWLDRGVDGFRIDVVHALGKDPTLPDLAAELASVPFCALSDHPSTHKVLRELRKVLDASPQRAVALGEVFLPRTEQIASYYGNGDELHLAFNFPAMNCRFSASCFTRRIDEAARFFEPRDAWPVWVLSNHDRPRHRTRFGGSERRARAAALLLLALRGTPCLYAGEELGLEDAVVAPEHAVDPGGRDGCRAPIPWDGSPDHGWALAGGPSWLPWPPDAGRRNVASLAGDDESILNLYRRMLALRRDSPALSAGTLDRLEVPGEVVAFERRSGDDCRVVVVNFSDSKAALAAEVFGSGRGLEVELASYGASGGPFDGTVAPEQALVLRPY